MKQQINNRRTEVMKEVEFIIDKIDGTIFLGQHDRTMKNELAFNKAEAIGKLTTRIVTAIESLRNNDSIYITIKIDKQ